MLPDDVTFDRPGNPLDLHPTWKHVACPTCGGPAAAKPTPSIPSSTAPVFRPFLLAPPAKEPLDREQGRSLDAGRPIYRRRRARDPAPALFALLHPRHEGCGYLNVAEPFAALSRRAWCCTKPIARPEDNRLVNPAEWSSSGGRRAQGLQGDATRAPVEIGPSRRCRSRRRTPSTRTIFTEHYGADTARWFMLSDSPPERDSLDRRGRARRMALHAARMAAHRRGLSTCCRTQKAKAPAGIFDRAALALRRAAHKGLNAVAEEIEGLRFNRAIAAVYEFANTLARRSSPEAARGGASFGFALKRGVDLLRPRGSTRSCRTWPRKAGRC